MINYHPYGKGSFTQHHTILVHMTHLSTQYIQYAATHIEG